MNNLKVIREAAGIAQAELARLIKANRTYINELESGKNKNPSLGKARLIAYYLKVDVDQIFPLEK